MGELRVLSLFSGIGGMDIGLERAGMKTVAFCEIDPFCQKVLRKHWPDVPIHSDIRELKGEHVGPVDVVAGGYPCQPFSTAGERRGAEDDRHLWPEMRRLVEELRPAWVIGENVAGHVTLGLDQVLFDLEALGYSTRAFVIPACAVDACHRRDRVWVIANSDERQRDEQANKVRARWNSANPCSQSSTANPMRCGQSGQGRAFDTSNKAEEGNREIHRTEHALRWPVKPPVRRGDDGLSRRLDQDRLRALGNAVVPQVVELIGKAIMAGGEG